MRHRGDFVIAQAGGCLGHRGDPNARAGSGAVIRQRLDQVVLPLVRDRRGRPAATVVVHMATRTTVLCRDGPALCREPGIGLFGRRPGVVRQAGKIRPEVADILVAKVGDERRHGRVRPATGTEKHKLPLDELILLAGERRNPRHRGNSVLAMTGCTNLCFVLACGCVRGGLRIGWQRDDHCQHQHT
jgi:hypothetical protein